MATSPSRRSRRFLPDDLGLLPEVAGVKHRGAVSRRGAVRRCGFGGKPPQAGEMGPLVARCHR
eukprot:3856325-Lingulodinium_polyedra.AAC.1